MRWRGEPRDTLGLPGLGLLDEGQALKCKAFSEGDHLFLGGQIAIEQLRALAGLPSHLTAAKTCCLGPFGFAPHEPIKMPLFTGPIVR